MSKTLIKDIQKILKEKKLYDGKIDGTIGPKTLGAVKDYLTTEPKVVIKEVVKEVPKVVEKIVSAATKTVPEPVVVDANTLKGRDRPVYAKNLLTQLGWKDYQAAAVVGQFMQESYADLRTNIWGDQKTAYGIGQWRDYNGQPGRLTDLFKFAQSLGKPIHDLETQIRFADWELTKGSEKAVGKALKAAKDLESALEVAIAYERPRGYTKDNPRAGHGWDNRKKFAESLM
mgnify:CR=1 FL=1